MIIQRVYAYMLNKVLLYPVGGINRN